MSLLSSILRRRKGHILLPLVAALLVTLSVTSVVADKPAAPETFSPDRRELWVPADKLEAVLKKHPKAVLLSREQFEALLVDAEEHFELEEEIKPTPGLPQAAVRNVSIVATPSGKAVKLVQVYNVEVPAQGWAELKLNVDPRYLASVEVDGSAALRSVIGKGKPNVSPTLILRGNPKDKVSTNSVTHEVVLTSIIPVRRTGSGASVEIIPPAAASASLTFEIPEGAKLDSEIPFVLSEDEAKANFALGGKNQPIRIRWSSEDITALETAAIFQKGSYLYSIDPVRLNGDLGFVLSSSLKDLPNEFEITLPDNVDVLRVEGTEVLRWDAEGDTIKVTMLAGERRSADFRVLVEMPTIAEGADNADVELPQPQVKGVHRASGTFAIFGSEDLRVRNIATPPLTLQAHGELEQTILQQPNFVAGFRFPAAAGSTNVRLQRMNERFTADLDTQVEFKREAIYLMRTIAVTPAEGEIFETRIELPAGEDMDSVTLADGTEPEWKLINLDEADEDAGKTVSVRWRNGLSVGTRQVFMVRTRRHPDGWFDLAKEDISLPFQSASIVGAEKVAGYLAVDFDGSYRVQTTEEEGLERRFAGYGEGAPVNGKLAWFRLRDYKLNLEVSRQAADLEADLIAYALPLAGSLEIEGQLSLDIGTAPLRDIELSLPGEVAKYFRLDSNLVSEKVLDDESSTWTFQFHQELIGRQLLKFRMSIPFEESEEEESDEDTGTKPFTTSIPAISIPEAKRIKGWWLVEANTDTELTFEAKGLDESDALRVPSISGYVPRHRVIAAYQFRGADYELAISGKRHKSESLVSTVIENLSIDSVVSTDGQSRHQVVCRLRSAGEQFIEVTLPASGDHKAELWSASINGEGVKPVRGADGNSFRVALPDTATNGTPVQIKFIYQSDADEWSTKGSGSLSPPKFSEDVPILNSQWRVHLPDGYSYRDFESNLSEAFEVEDKSLVSVVGDEFNPLRVIANAGQQADSVSERPRAMELQEFQHQEEELNSLYEQKAGSDEFEEGSKEYIRTKLRQIIIPSINFRETTLRDAVNTLESLSRDLDVTEPEENLRGVRIQIDGGGLDVESATVTLESSNLPLKTAIEYVAILTGMKYQVTPNGILLTPRSAPESPDIYTRVFQVPPNFLDLNIPSTGPVDPFAPSQPSSETALKPKPTAKNIFEANGITFPPGTAVFYDKSTSQLTVAQTATNMALIETFVEPLHAGEPDPASPSDSKAAGLISLDFNIPEGGSVYTFTGLYAPEELQFEFAAWEREVRIGWLWIALGAMLYFLLGFERPLFLGIFGALLLAFVPMIIWQSAIVTFNAILIGWLGAMVVRLVCRVFQFFESRGKRAAAAESHAW